MDWDDDLDCEQIDALEQVALSVQLSAQHADRPPQPLCRPSQTQTSQPTLYAPSQNMQTVASSQPPPTSQNPHQACHGAVVERADHPPNIPDPLPPYGGPPRSLHELKHRIQAFKGEVLFLPPPPPPSHTCPGVYGRGCGGSMEWCSFEHLEGVPPFWGCSKYWEEGGRGACSYKYYPPERLDKPRLDVGLIREDVLEVRPFVGAEDAVQACGGVELLLKLAGVDLRRALPVPPAARVAGARNGVLRQAEGGHTEIKGILDAEGMVETRKTDGVDPQAASRRADAYHCQSLNQGKRTIVGSALGPGSDQQSQEAARPNNVVQPGGVLSPGCSACQHPNAQTCVAMDRDDDVAMVLLTWQSSGGVRFPFAYYKNLTDALQAANHDLGGDCLLPSGKPAMPRGTFAAFTNTRAHRCSAEEVERRYAKLPLYFESALLPFQREGVKFALERKGRCLIADEMGVGKTVQAIAVARCYRDEDWPLLIVCPASLRLVWAEELEKWLPDLDPANVHVIMDKNDALTIKPAACGHDTPAETATAAMEQHCNGNAKSDNSRFLPEVTIISYTMLEHLTCDACKKARKTFTTSTAANNGRPCGVARSPQRGGTARYSGSCMKPHQCMASMHWGMLIADESHVLRTSTASDEVDAQHTEALRSLTSCPTLRAKRLVFLSGTPSLNRPFDLWNQIAMLRPGLLGSNRKEFGNNYCGRRLLPVAGRYRDTAASGRPGSNSYVFRKRWDCSGLTRASELHLLLRQEIMLRRLKRDVLDQLPAKRRQVIRLPKPPPKDWPKRDGARRHCADDSDASSSEDDEDEEDRGHEAAVAATLGAGKEKAAQTEQRGDDLPAAGIGKFGSANAVSGVDQRTDTAVSGDEMLSPAPPVLERKMSAQHRTGIAKCRLATEWIMTQLGLDEGDATTLSENAMTLDANEAFAECDDVGGVENSTSASLSASHTSFCATTGKQRRPLSASNASITPSTVGTPPKFIIFAHHRAVMNHLAAELDRALMVGNNSNSGRGGGGVGVRRRFEFVRVDGETDAEGRREAVERFRSDARVRVALLSVTAAGVGLDFSAASGVVFVELPAEVWLVRQAEDRAHRHGQKQTVNVYFLCARGTCDERHWQRLSSSLAQVGAVHDGPLEHKRSDAAVIGNTNSGAPLGIGDARIATKSVTAGQATAAALGEAAGLLVDDVMTLATQVEMPIGCNTSLKMKINTTDNLVIAPPVDVGGGPQKVVATNDGNAPSSPSQVADVNEHGVHGDDGAPLLLLCDPALSTHHHHPHHHPRVGPVGDTCQGNDAVGGHGKTGQLHLESSAQNLSSLQDRAAKTTPLSVLHHRHHQTHPDTNAGAGIDTANAHSPVQTAHLAANATQPCDGDDATGQEHVIALTCSPLQGQPEGKTVADASLSLLPHGNGSMSTDAGLHTKALVLLECDGDASSRRGANGIAKRAEYRRLPGTNVGEGSISSHEMITSSSSAAAAAAVAAAVTGCALGTQRAPESHQSHPRAPSLLHSTFSWWFEVSAHTQRVHFHAAEDRSKPLLLSLPLEALLAPSAPCIPQLIQAVQSQLQPSKLASASAPATQGMPATSPRNDINVVIACVGPLAIDVSLLCGDIQVLHTAVQAARDFAAEWKELTPARRNRLMNKILQAPLEDAAEAAHQAAVAEGAFGNGTERFRRDGLCGIIDMHHDGCCVAEEANARMLSLTTLPPPTTPPPGAEWKVVAVHYRKHRRTVLYRQAFRQKQPVVANRNQATATANGKGTRNEDELAIASNSPNTEQAVNDDSTLMMPTTTRTLEATAYDLLCGSEPQTREHQALKAGHDGAEPTWIRLCLQCQKEVPNCEDVPLPDSSIPLNSLWTLFCDAKCERKYALARSGHAGRRAVLRRDRGICAECGLNCTTMVRRLQAIERGTKKWRVRRRELLQSEYSDFVFRAGVKAVDALVERATPGHAWQADHIIPVYAGGGQCDVDNLRTLCTPCHLAVTKAQAKERAAERRAQKLGCVTRNNPGRNTGTTTNNAHNANTKKNDDDIDNDDANAAESVEKKPTVRRRGKRQREKLKESDEEDGEERIRARKERATTGGRGKDANKKSMHMRRTHRGRGVRVPAHAAEMVAREGVACARDVAGVYDGAVAGLDRTDGPDEKNADMTIDLTKE